MKPLQNQSKNTQSSHIFLLFKHLWGQRRVTEWNVQPNTLHEGLPEYIWPRAWPTMALLRGCRKTCLALLSRLQSGKRWGTWRVKKGYFPSHTGSPRSVWCWITHRKRNLRVKGQESLTSEGGGYRESLSENFDLSGYEERVTSEVSLTMCSSIVRFSSCFWNSVHLRTFISVVSAIWHNACCLERKCLFISALFSLLRCSSSYSFLLSSKCKAWKQFVLPKENTIMPHSYTHDFQRMPWMCSQRGKKNSVPSKVQTNCPLAMRDFPKQPCEVRCMGGPGMEK